MKILPSTSLGDTRVSRPRRIEHRTDGFDEHSIGATTNVDSSEPTSRCESGQFLCHGPENAFEAWYDLSPCLDPASTFMAPENAPGHYPLDLRGRCLITSEEQTEYEGDRSIYKERAVYDILAHGPELLGHYKRLHSDSGYGWLEGLWAWFQVYRSKGMQSLRQHVTRYCSHMRLAPDIEGRVLLLLGLHLAGRLPKITIESNDRYIHQVTEIVLLLTGDEPDPQWQDQSEQFCACLCDVVSDMKSHTERMPTSRQSLLPMDLGLKIEILVLLEHKNVNEVLRILQDLPGFSGVEAIGIDDPYIVNLVPSLHEAFISSLLRSVNSDAEHAEQICLAAFTFFGLSSLISDRLFPQCMLDKGFLYGMMSWLLEGEECNPAYGFFCLCQSLGDFDTERRTLYAQGHTTYRAGYIYMDKRDQGIRHAEAIDHLRDTMGVKDGVTIRI